MTPWKPITKPDDRRSPAVLSPRNDFAEMELPEPSPAKKPCLDARDDMPTDLITPKAEPADMPEDLSESREDFHGSIKLDPSVMDSSTGEPSNWMPDKVSTDSSSPGK